MKRGVLVPYLDAWTRVALRSRHGALFVEAGDGDFVADAYRVFGESADLLAAHHLEMVVIGAGADSVGGRGEGAPCWHLDVVEGGLTEADAWRLAATVGWGSRGRRG